ncbi:MAG TPA: hypothetical protein VMN79_17090 [Casimicrobiaceae bacterium]|nr:hypothetical protein [Casimicrobiaceae bacterium]
MHRARAFATLAAGLSLACASCVVAPPQSDYDAFLAAVRHDCEPIILGSDNMGQAMLYNGFGVDADSYHSFANLTEALYYGKISPAMYVRSLTATVGWGSHNDRSFDCILGHLPRQSLSRAAGRLRAPRDAPAQPPPTTERLAAATP